MAGDSTQDASPATAAEAARAIRVVVGRLRRRLREVAAGELTPSQASVLTRLAKGEAASASALAALEGVRPQSIASTLNALEQAGLVARSPDPQDGRRAIVELTEAGRAEDRGNRQAREEWLTAALESQLGEEERRTVLAAMTLLERLARP
ncbi:MarR family transcriptional regulator [Amnibacterium sp.]|uniref:MarR family winged helix-turn-helix transcriptional regulator n=1 Tax=Amnibacterium sp. TaxID=1872496 RepID=UPI00261F65BD|nr:MarR family transcriptional regulator [Amnibacterium sp.]MCU1474494.1 putative MarR-family regulatory protein [Amnibacterium sp.]